MEVAVLSLLGTAVSNQSIPFVTNVNIIFSSVVISIYFNSVFDSFVVLLSLVIIDGFKVG